MWGYNANLSMTPEHLVIYRKEIAKEFKAKGWGDNEAFLFEDGEHDLAMKTRRDLLQPALDVCNDVMRRLNFNY